MGTLKVLSLNHNDSGSPNAFPLNLLPNKNISVDQGGVNATFNVFVIFSPFFPLPFPLFEVVSLFCWLKPNNLNFQRIFAKSTLCFTDCNNVAKSLMLP